MGDCAEGGGWGRLEGHTLSVHLWAAPGAANEARRVAATLGHRHQPTVHHWHGHGLSEARDCLNAHRAAPYALIHIVGPASGRMIHMARGLSKPVVLTLPEGPAPGWWQRRLWWSTDALVAESGAQADRIRGRRKSAPCYVIGPATTPTEQAAAAAAYDIVYGRITSAPDEPTPKIATRPGLSVLSSNEAAPTEPS